MHKSAPLICLICLSGLALGQAPAASDAKLPAAKGTPTKFGPSPLQELRDDIAKSEDEGVEVRIKDIAHFRGIRSNQLTGFGLVIGLEGTGDTKKTPMTQNLISNMFADFGTGKVDPSTIDPKNVALVMVTAELPPFAKPGSTVDVRVSSVGDAKSLQGGTLLQTPLYPAGNHEKAYVVADGALSIGGFNAASGGASVQRNHVNVGRIPDGGIVEASVPTKLVFTGNTMFLELAQEDLTTAQRVASRIFEAFPAMSPVATDGATIQITLPEGLSPVTAMSEIELIKVYADVEAKVVINERTGTIVIGGNVRLGPAAVAHGSLNVRIDVDPYVSQPAPFSQGTTKEVDKTTVDANQEKSKIAVVPPNTTVADLARILQILELKPTDIISILQGLHQQGALKAKIEIQ